MTRNDVLSLHPGDEVFWSDPDGGLCSKYLTIRELAVFFGDDPVVRIFATDGDVLECFAHELS